MKVDLEQVLKNPKGEPFADNATLGQAAYSALGAQLPSDGALAPEKKLAIFRISTKLAHGGEQELTAEDIALIKDRAAQALPIFAFGAVAAALENAASVKQIKAEEAPATEARKA